MKHTTSSVGELLTNTKPLVPMVTNGVKTISTNGTNGNDKHAEVTALLEMTSDLYGPTYKGYYAKAFYKLSRDLVLRIAAECRQEGRKPAVLFSYKIKQALGSD